MEYVDGPSLREFLLDIEHHKVSLTVQVIVHILTEVLIALEYAHRRPKVFIRRGRRNYQQCIEPAPGDNQRSHYIQADIRR